MINIIDVIREFRERDNFAFLYEELTRELLPKTFYSNFIKDEIDKLNYYSSDIIVIREKYHHNQALDDFSRAVHEITVVLCMAIYRKYDIEYPKKLEKSSPKNNGVVETVFFLGLKHYSKNHSL